MRIQRIPPATIARLHLYVQGLKALAREGVDLTSSQRLARATGLEASQIRRDLSYLGAFGTPGVGYSVEALLSEISHYLGLSHTWPVALVGCGKLGSALAAYVGFQEQNFQIAAVFDTNPDLVGSRVGGLQITALARLREVVAELGIHIAIIATPPGCAQEVADQLVAAGVTSLLNFAPTALVVPGGINVRNVDLAAEMLMLSFHETMNRASVARRPIRPGAERRVPLGQRERV